MCPRSSSFGGTLFSISLRSQKLTPNAHGLCQNHYMGNKQVRIEIGSGFSGLPHLDDHQRVLLQRMMNSDAVLRGAPGSGKTTLLLSAVAELVRQGRSFFVLTPDRSRADALMPAVQSMAPDAVRPVRTPTAWAYSIVSQWRNTRDEPLGDVELLNDPQLARRSFSNYSSTARF